MFSIQPFLIKGDKNEYNLFRVLEPSTEQDDKLNNEEGGESGNNKNNANEDSEGNEVAVVAATPEVTRQIMMDKCLESDYDWLYTDWNVRGILPSPMRLVMFRPSMCQLCGVVDANIGHSQFYSGYVYEHAGFNYCFHCKDKFFGALKARAEPIWELLQCETLREFWAPRTRRDPVTNERLYSGKYKYEKWRAISKHVSYSIDNTKGMPGIENVPFIYCEMNDATKSEALSWLKKQYYDQYYGNSNK